MTTKRDKFDLPEKDPKIRKVVAKLMLQSKFMPVKTVTFRLRSMTLYILLGKV